MNVLHKYHVKHNVILDTLGLRNILRGNGKSPYIFNFSGGYKWMTSWTFRALCSQKVSLGFRLGGALDG